MQRLAKQVISGVFAGILTVFALTVNLPEVHAASGPKFIYTFDEGGTDAGVFRNGDDLFAKGVGKQPMLERIDPEEGAGKPLQYTAKINTDVSAAKRPNFEGAPKAATGWGRSMELTLGKWTLANPQWQNFYLNIPENAQDWSGYKHFGFFWNNQLCDADNQAGMILFFEDADGELWGWDSGVNVQECWTYTKVDPDGNLTLDYAGSAWQGFGHDNWYGYYITVVLDPSKFVRKSDNAQSNGNNKMDFNKINRIQVQVALFGAAGVARSGDIMYFDDFFLAKQLRTKDNQYLADNVAINLRNEGKTKPFSDPLSSNSAGGSSAAKSSAAGSLQAASSAVSGEVTASGEVSSDQTSTNASEDGTDKSSSRAGSRLAESGASKGLPGGMIAGIVIGIIVLLGGAGAAVLLLPGYRR